MVNSTKDKQLLSLEDLKKLNSGREDIVLQILDMMKVQRPTAQDVLKAMTMPNPTPEPDKLDWETVEQIPRWARHLFPKYFDQEEE